nr:hypothetical protein [Candidatus Sigynarchaeota archaeon]
MADAVFMVEILCAVLDSVLLGEVAGLFAFQYRKSRESLSSLLTLCFCSFCGSSIFYFIRFFIIFDLFYRIEVTMRFAAFTTFVFLFEHQFKKRRVPLLTIGCISCMLLILILPYDLAYTFSFTIYLAAIAVFWFFFQVLLKVDGQIRKRMISAIGGAFVLGIGIGLSADLVVTYGGQLFLLSGLLVQLVGMIVIGLNFYSIRTADEFLWYNNVQTIYVIYNSVCLFAYSVEKDSMLKEGDLLGGGLATVLLISQTIVKSDEPPSHIEFQDLNFLVKVGDREFSGKRVIAVLQVKKNLAILHEKLDRFVNSFETQFSGVLEGSSGVINIAKINQQGGQLASVFRAKRR